MTFKEHCSIESNAFNNPNAIIRVESIKAKIDEALLMKYPNIKWSILDTEDAFEGTPLMDWWISDKLTNHDSYFRYAHLADALRLCLVYKNGGFYSDLDHIAIKSLEPLTKFSFLANGREDSIDIENSYFYGSKKHDYFKMVVEEFAKTYNATSWAGNGPLLLQRCAHRYCKTEKLEELLMKVGEKVMENLTNKCDIRILPNHISHPYPWNITYKMFDHDEKIEVARFIDTYTIHFNSKVTSQLNVTQNEKSMIEFFMLNNCPISYETYVKNEIL